MKTSDIEVEERVLTLMLNNEGFARIGARRLTSEDFTQHHCRNIFAKIQEDVKAGGDGDRETVIAAFTADDNMIGAEVENYATIVNRLGHSNLFEGSLTYFTRQSEALQLITRKRKMDRSVRELYNFLEGDDILGAEGVLKSYIEGLKHKSARSEARVIDYKTNFNERWSEAQEPLQQNAIVVCFAPIDDNFGHISRGDLHMFVARTGGGKSVCKQHIAANAARVGHKVAIFTKEDTEKQVAFRLDAHMSRIDHPKFHRHSLTDTELEQWEHAIEGIPENRIKICCMGSEFTPQAIRDELDKMSMGGFTPDLIVVDYVNIMRPDDHRLMGHEAIDHVVRGLKALALEYDVGIVTSCQMRPEFYNEEAVTFECFAGSKLGVSMNVDGLYAFIRTDVMASMDMARIQVMKGRQEGIQVRVYDIEPNFHRIVVHANWRYNCGAE